MNGAILPSCPHCRSGLPPVTRFCGHCGWDRWREPPPGAAWGYLRGGALLLLSFGLLLLGGVAALIPGAGAAPGFALATTAFFGSLLGVLLLAAAAAPEIWRELAAALARRRVGAGDACAGCDEELPEAACFCIACGRPRWRHPGARTWLATLSGLLLLLALFSAGAGVAATLLQYLPYPHPLNPGKAGILLEFAGAAAALALGIVGLLGLLIAALGRWIGADET